MRCVYDRADGILYSCFALYSTHGEMRASAMFDEKFFEVGDVQSLLTTAVQFFQQFGEQQPMARM